jgi:alginate O-acetyltransferase complex protein AlgI
VVFTSLTFLYAFLPLTLALYFLCPNRRWRNGVLLLASLLFYSWGEPKHILLMLLATAIAYVGGLLISRTASEASKPHGLWNKVVFILTVAALLGNLIIFKYLNFFSDTLGLSLPVIDLPIGISFYTFQILSYVIDLYRGHIRVQKNPCYLLLYVSLFPQLIAGPIVRYQTVESEILDRKETWEDFMQGLHRFILGLGKKVLLANNAATVATAIYASEAAGTTALWLGALAYTLQIYFDFSGYSDMAIGMGRMFGFHFLENFDYPYCSRSVTEFWRRWHISLSSWFRDYVYIPLGGNRVSTLRWVRNILVVWALTGLWHGASWNFVLWGLYYGCFLLLEKLWFHRLLDRLPAPVQWLYTMLVVMVGWVLFNLTDFAQLGHTLKLMFSYTKTSWFTLIASDSEPVFGTLFLPLCILFSFPIARRFWAARSTPMVVLQNVLCLMILVLCIAFLLSATFNPFIYFRF